MIIIVLCHEVAKDYFLARHVSGRRTRDVWRDVYGRGVPGRCTRDVWRNVYGRWGGSGRGDEGRRWGGRREMARDMGRAGEMGRED